MTEEIKKASHEDVEKNKAMAIVGYIFPFLFFVPLVNDESKKSEYARFHANEQLILLIYWVGGSILFGICLAILSFVILAIVPIAVFVLPLLVSLVWFAFSVFGIVLIILGAVSASNGSMKALPLIGRIEIIKK